MGDQGIEARPALGLEDGRDRAWVGGVGGEAVDGLGRQNDEPAAAQDLGRLLGRGGCQCARCAVRATFTVTLVSTTSPVFH